MIERTSDHDVLEGRFVLRNRREEIERAEGSVLEMVERRGYGRSSCFAVRLAMAEAPASALEHTGTGMIRGQDPEAGVSYRPVLGGDRGRRSRCMLRPTGWTRSDEAGEPRHSLRSRYRVDASVHDRSRVSPAGQPGVHDLCSPRRLVRPHGAHRQEAAHCSWNRCSWGRRQRERPKKKAPSLAREPFGVFINGKRSRR